LTFSPQGVFSQSAQRSIENLQKIYDVSSTANKGRSSGVIRDKPRFLRKECGVFYFEVGKLDSWQKARPDLKFD